MYISIEGLDGAGKSTAKAAVIEWLNENQPGEILETREPGTGKLGEIIRGILLDDEDLPKLMPDEELYLFTVNRKVNYRNIIEPALRDGVHVLSDRCYFSSYAYQGVSMDMTRLFHKTHSDICPPDIVLLMTCDVDEAQSRIAGRNEKLDKIEQRGISQQKIAEIRYRQLGGNQPNAICVDASGTIEETFAKVKEKLTEMMLTITPLSIIANGDYLHYNGSEGPVRVPVDRVVNRLFSKGYEVEYEDGEGWYVEMGHATLADGIIGRVNAVKLALSCAIREGHFHHGDISVT